MVEDFRQLPALQFGAARRNAGHFYLLGDS